MTAPGAPDPLPAIRAALVDRDLINPDDLDLPHTCARIRRVAAHGDVDTVAEHLDVVERLGPAGSDVITQAARQIVTAVQEEKNA